MPRPSGRHVPQIPGPISTPLPLRAAVAGPTIDHRGSEFAAPGFDVIATDAPLRAGAAQ